MLVADARTQVKKYLDIDASITAFDSDIDSFVSTGVKRLYPLAQREVDPQTANISSSYGRASVNLAGLTVPLAGVRSVEVNGGSFPEPVDFSVHANMLKLLDVPTYANTAIIEGLARFTLADLYPEYELAVIYFATSEFYKFLMGNKRKYNIYMQNGRAAVENMQDMVDYFEGLANQHLGDRTMLYGA